MFCWLGGVAEAAVDRSDWARVERCDRACAPYRVYNAVDVESKVRSCIKYLGRLEREMGSYIEMKTDDMEQDVEEVRWSLARCKKWDVVY